MRAKAQLARPKRNAIRPCGSLILALPMPDYEPGFSSKGISSKAVGTRTAPALVRHYHLRPLRVCPRGVDGDLCGRRISSRSREKEYLGANRIAVPCRRYIGVSDDGLRSGSVLYAKLDSVGAVTVSSSYGPSSEEVILVWPRRSTREVA